MKKTIIFFTVILLLSFTKIQQSSAFQQLTILAGGTWVMKTKKGTLCEQWKKTNNNLFNNRAYRTEGNDTILMEHVTLSLDGNEINYTSTVPDQNNAKPVAFKLIEFKDDQFVFSNPEHDFPQRIVYHFISKDSLHAWIDGKYNGKERKQDFYYKRMRN